MNKTQCKKGDRCGSIPKLGEKFDLKEHCLHCIVLIRGVGKEADRFRKYDATPIPSSTKAFKKIPLRTVCPYQGRIYEECSCGDRERRNVYYCNHPTAEIDFCTRGDINSERVRCNDCIYHPDMNRKTKDYTSLLIPDKRIPVNLPGHFNSSILRWNGRLVLASRKGSMIHISELGDQFQILSTKKLKLPHHPACRDGADDPRLFIFRGKLHVSFAGLNRGKGPKDFVISQLYARLDSKYDVEEIFRPTYADEEKVEKNWIYFEHEDQLFAIYSISPHKILKIEENKAELAYQTKNWKSWSGGYLRGGTGMIQIGDEMVGWFHGADDDPVRRTYNLGVYAFEAKPPFNITRLTPHPLIWASDSDRIQTEEMDGSEGNCIFPCGAFLENGIWSISCGVADCRIEIMQWEDSKVQELLK